MPALLIALFAALGSTVRSRLELEAEVVALRHQLAVLQRQAPRRPRLGRADRLLWVVLSRMWPNWRQAVQIVTPATVVRWHRRGFALYWSWKSRVFVVLLHDRRRVVHVNVTAHPTAAWTAHQLREARPWDSAPRFFLRDRDGIYGPERQTAMRAMGIEEVVIAPRAPWQNPFVERVIGSLRRECLEHLIVWNERSLRRHIEQDLAYYHDWRTHLSLDKDAPILRPTQPPTCGTIKQIPHLGGLHHHHERKAP
jgi:transposase InsO family protein